MKTNNLGTAFSATLIFTWAVTAWAEPIQITIEGTPNITLTKPIQIAPSDAAPQKWEYRIYPPQTGPDVVMECEPEAFAFVEEIRRAGNQRWELVNFVNIGLGDGDGGPCLIAVFKRPTAKK